jgi:DnaJ-class molecular chaperone
MFNDKPYARLARKERDTAGRCRPAPKSNHLRDSGETCRHCQGEGKVFFMPTLTVECKYCNGTGRLSLRNSGDELRYSKACADNRKDTK